MEYLRSNGTVGFPWMSLANTQLDFLTLAQNVEICGIYGISFWVVSINILLFNFLVRPFPENSFKVLFFFIFPWLTGLWLTPSYKGDHVNSLDVAVVQPNIHLSDKRKPSSLQKNIESLLNDSKPAINNNIDQNEDKSINNTIKYEYLKGHTILDKKEHFYILSI